MHAEDFSANPRRSQAAQSAKRAGMEPRIRQLHRWVSVIFTLTVAANFIAMIWGQPPAGITYSPLPPLLLLLLSGLYMLVRHQARARRASRSLPTQR